MRVSVVILVIREMREAAQQPDRRQRSVSRTLFRLYPCVTALLGTRKKADGTRLRPFAVKGLIIMRPPACLR
jgi:hypothetical protein